MEPALLTFYVDLNKPVSRATDVLSIPNSTDWMYYRNHHVLPESGDYDVMKAAVMQRCCPIDWGEYNQWLNLRVRGVIMCKQAHEWISLYEELGPMASIVDLIIYLSGIYHQDPALKVRTVDFTTEEVLTWADRENFNYTFRGYERRNGYIPERIDPERYV